MIRSALLIILLASLFASRARAVIHAATPPDSLYKSCPTVVTGTVTKFSADTGNLEAAATTLKGTAPGEVLRFKITDLPAITARIKVGDALVLFMARQDKNAALHLADTWLLPEKKGPALFAVTAEKDLRQSYPGTTATLVQLLTAAKEGKYDMLNEVHPDAFKGTLKDLGKLDVAQPIRLYAGRFGIDQNQSLIAVTADGSKIYTLNAMGIVIPGKAGPVFPANTVGFDTVPFPFTPLAGQLAALTKDGSIVIAPTDKPFQLDTPIKLFAGGAPALAGAIGYSFLDGNNPASFVIKESGMSLHPLAAPDNAADFTRLTGERLETYFKGDKPFAGATASKINVNGDSRPDLLIHTPTRDLLLINRGYGAYFINADVGKAFVDAAGKPLLTEKTLWTALDVDGDHRDDLVFLTEDGTLRALLNPKPKDDQKP